MATTNIKGKRPAAESPQQALPLSDLLGALSRDFVAAAVSHHATMTYWKQAYETNPVLSDYQPPGMKIVSAQVSLPVAVAQVTSKPPRVAQLTKTMIAEAIEGNFPKSERQDLARAIHADLAKKDKLSFSSATLLTDINEAVKRHLPDIPNPINGQFLSDLRRDFLAQPAGDSGVSLLYRAKDLEQVKPDLIMRLNLELRLE